VPNQLSGGQQQRVALARALVLEPAVVLLDEPLSNLDAKLRLEMREQIHRLHRDLLLTMIYVTHDQSEALSMADRMAVMREGRLCQVGTPREVYQRPANRFTASFIGEANWITGTIQVSGGQPVIETGTGPVRIRECAKDIRTGDVVYGCIRPENLEIGSTGEGEENRFTGRVSRIVYLGDQEQIFVQMGEGQEMKLIRSGKSGDAVKAGDEVVLRCGIEDVQVLKD
jgi:ABC-type Fe3+/spermidine/putrescine transport system ATPase subunit